MPPTVVQIPFTLPSERVANLDAIACATQSVVSEGPAAGCRAIDLRVWGGVDLRLLPDRGCDIGAAWFRGVPLAWISAVGETGPVADWGEGFGGGLVTTCGLQNVGAPSEGHGLHGAFSQRRATVLAVERLVEADRTRLTVRALVRDGEALGPQLEVERRITTEAGRGLVALRDVTRNPGAGEVAAPLLYHVNLGPALWDEGAELVVAGGRSVIPRDEAAAAALDGAARPPEAIPAPERVYEHDFEAGSDGWGRVELRAPRAGVRLVLAFDAATLPRLHQWVHPAPGVYALAVEPANCSVLGRAADREAERLPTLAAGAERVTRLRFELSPLG